MEEFPQQKSKEPKVEKDSRGALGAFKVIHQKSEAYQQSGTRINEALWYHVSKEYPGQVGIHLYAMDVGNTVKERKTALNLYKEGLSELAYRLESEPNLLHIKAITGWSKVVYEHPKLLELLGFEVTERNEDTNEALAIMSREDFLKRYGQSVQNEIPTENGRDDVSE